MFSQSKNFLFQSAGRMTMDDDGQCTMHTRPHPHHSRLSTQTAEEPKDQRYSERHAMVALRAVHCPWLNSRSNTAVSAVGRSQQRWLQAMPTAINDATGMWTRFSHNAGLNQQRPPIAMPMWLQTMASSPSPASLGMEEWQRLP